MLLMLRCYQSLPINWGHIINEMKENLGHLSGPVKELYTSSADKQIRDRLCNKFGKLMREGHKEDDDIRREVEAIGRLEMRLVQTTSSHNPSSSASGSDVREAASASFSDAGSVAEESRQTETPTQSTARADNYVPSVNPVRKVPRMRPLIDLLSENQLHYNRFITKEVPKLLRQLGVSSDESD